MRMTMREILMVIVNGRNVKGHQCSSSLTSSSLPDIISSRSSILVKAVVININADLTTEIKIQEIYKGMTMEN